MPMKKVFFKIDKEEFIDTINKFKILQDNFYQKFGVKDIFSNSKFFEMVIASHFGHDMIPGHSGSKDARDSLGNEFEYKHFKENSSNHSWTFNDYSDSTIESLKRCKSVIFAHIDDSFSLGSFDWYISIPGDVCSDYLDERTKSLLFRKPKGRVNARKMINISPSQLIQDLGADIKKTSEERSEKIYDNFIYEVFKLNDTLETIVGVSNLLTSNKIWEVIVAVELNHNVSSDQGGNSGAFDAFDKDGNEFEYKVSKNKSWNFQDISSNVLNKYLDYKKIILATVNKEKYEVLSVYEADPELVVNLLSNKLIDKRKRFEKLGKSLRRLQVSLTAGDLVKVGATQIF